MIWTIVRSNRSILKELGYNNNNRKKTKMFFRDMIRSARYGLIHLIMTPKVTKTTDTINPPPPPPKKKKKKKKDRLILSGLPKKTKIISRSHYKNAG